VVELALVLLQGYFFIKDHPSGFTGLLVSCSGQNYTAATQPVKGDISICQGKIEMSYSEQNGNVLKTGNQ